MTNRERDMQIRILNLVKNVNKELFSVNTTEDLPCKNKFSNQQLLQDFIEIDRNCMTVNFTVNLIFLRSFPSFQKHESLINVE